MNNAATNGAQAMNADMYTVLASAKRHLAMVQAAHRHLGASARVINAGRIRAAQDAVDSAQLLVDLVTRDGGFYTDRGDWVAA
jgi:hypothetical protein